MDPSLSGGWEGWGQDAGQVRFVAQGALPGRLVAPSLCVLTWGQSKVSGVSPHRDTEPTKDPVLAELPRLW